MHFGKKPDRPDFHQKSFGHKKGPSPFSRGKPECGKSDCGKKDGKSKESRDKSKDGKDGKDKHHHSGGHHHEGDGEEGEEWHWAYEEVDSDDNR